MCFKERLFPLGKAWLFFCTFSFLFLILLKSAPLHEVFLIKRMDPKSYLSSLVEQGFLLKNKTYYCPLPEELSQMALPIIWAG